MTPEELDQLVALIDRYAAQTQAQEKEAQRQAAEAWVGIDWYDAAAVAAAAVTSAEVSSYAVNTASGLAGQLYLLAIALMGGTAPAISVGRLDVGPVRGETVDMTDVYERVAKRARIDLAKGLDTAEAERDAARLLDQTIAADLMLARRAAMHAMLTASATVTKYRRVVRPELSVTGVCGLCLAAADKVYSRGDLLPIHHRCKCIVLPIVDADERVPQYVNRVTLEDLYTAADSTRGRELKKIRYRIEQHGELGPVLVQKGHRFTGPVDLVA